MAAAYQYCGLGQTRGLENYKNTCWLNSVLQCLAQTPHLYEELCRCVQESENLLEIPGGTLTLNGSTIVLPQIEIEVDYPGTITYCLYMTLRSLASEDTNTYYPFRFLHSIGSCLPQFIIGEHNDSHEFVRCLLETLRTEKQDKYRQAIGRAIKIIKETNPELYAEEDEDQVTNFYCSEASKKFLSPLEKYFRGSLQTSLQCVQCKTITYRQDDFFDLSIPITESNLLNYKNMESAFDERNDVRHIRFMHFVNNNHAQLLESKSDQSISILLYYSLLHNMVLNNYKMIINNLNTNQSSVSTAIEITNGNGENKMNAGALDNNAMEMNMDCLDVKNENQIAEFAAEQEDKIVETKIENSHVDLENVNIEEISNSLDSKFATPMEEDQPELSLVAGTNENQIENKADFEVYSIDSATKEEIPEASLANNHIEDFDWNGFQENDAIKSDAIKDSIQYVENYCFLKTCLDNFFGEELLTDDNKVICEECSNQSGGNGKKVLRDTLTRFKISSPPHILILHLKRFNFLNGEILKNNTKVFFPTILDMAPFCTTELDIERGGVPLLYSLYAVNEHFGTMEMGHYVSYRRLEIDNDEYVSNHTLPGQWIITNDENVEDISENYVTNVKAYILFYKRIF